MNPSAGTWVPSYGARLLLVAALAAADGCGARMSAPTGGPLPTEAAERPAAPAPPEPPEDAVVSISRRAPGTEILALGGARYFADGVRIEADDAGVRVARQSLIGDETFAVPLGGAWVYASRLGVVARSETFLGEVTRVGEVGDLAEVQRATQGLLALVTLAGAIFVTDGRAVVAAGPTRVPARVVAFADERLGAAVLADGGLAVTRDGGASWSDVPLARDEVSDVRFDRGALRVRTLRGWSTIAPDGHLSLSERVRLPEPDEGLDGPTSEAIRRELRARSARIDASPRGTVRLADGATLRVDGPTLERRGRDGAVSASSQLPDPGCEVRAWGPAAALVCRGRLYRTTDGETLSLVHASNANRVDPYSGLVLSDDGLHLAIPGPCGSGLRSELAHQGACVLLDGVGAWRQVVFPEGYDAPAEFGGARLLFSGCAAGVCRAAVVDADTGEARAVSAEASPDAGELALVSRPRLTRDGALVAAARRVGAEPGAPTWLLRGDPLRPLPARPMPPGTIDVIFDDSARGIAVGADAGSLTRTLDGGRSWQSLPVPLDGTASWGEYQPDETRCNRSGCVIAGAIAVRGWGPARAAEERWFSMVPAVREPRADPAPRPVPLLRLRCDGDGRVRGNPSRRDAGDELPGSWLSGLVRVQPSAPEGTTGDALTWVGEGVRAGTATLPRVVRSWQELRVLGAGARGPLLRDASRLLPAWLGPRAGFLSLADATWELRFLDYGAGDALAVPAADGGVLALASAVSDSIAVLIGARVSAAGALAAARATRIRSFDYGLAQVRGRSAIAQLLSGRRVSVTPLDDGPAESLGTLPARLTVCPDVIPAGASTITWASRRSSALVEIEALRSIVLQVEMVLSPGVACVRGVIGRGERGASAGALRLRASAGRLTGHRDEEATREQIRCEVLP